MKKVVTVVGARPQFVKAAPVSMALRQCFREVLVNTGQHYDRLMADVFFNQLGIPAPDYDLGIGSGSHGDQTGRMLIALEQVLLDEQPDWLLVYGDTNSTVAGALAAAKLHVPIVHVEAGLRSFNRRMPEEINRVITDHVSTLLFAPTETAVTNLVHEGITAGVHLVGDVMCDTVRLTLESTSQQDILDAYGLQPGGYYLLTVHRPQNADDPQVLAGILVAMGALDRPVIFPVHPRTRARMEGPDLEAVLAQAPNVRLIEPVGYRESLALQQGAVVVVTDSGGVQKEAFLLGRPCVTLREETEWVETVHAGWNELVGANPDRIRQAVAAAGTRPRRAAPNLYGDGHTADRIVEIMASGLLRGRPFDAAHVRPDGVQVQGG